MSVRVDTDGFEAALERIRLIRSRAQDVTPAWEALLDWWARSNVEHFTGGGHRWAAGWAPLAPSTLREKAEGGYPLAPLIRTGSLLEDLIHRPFGFEDVDRRQVFAGTTHRAARFHQRGTGRMPRRVLVDGGRLRSEGVATRAVRNWIMDGNTSISALP